MKGNTLQSKEPHWSLRAQRQQLLWWGAVPHCGWHCYWHCLVALVPVNTLPSPALTMGSFFSGEWEGKASFSPLPVRETCREAAWAYFRQELFSELCSLLGVWEVAAGLGTTFKCPLADRREKRWLESYRAHSVCSLCTGQQEYLRGQSNSTSPSLNPRT